MADEREKVARWLFLFRYGYAWIPDTGRNLEMEGCRRETAELCDLLEELGLLQDREPVERDRKAIEPLELALHRCSGFEILKDIDDTYHVYLGDRDGEVWLAQATDPITALVLAADAILADKEGDDE